MRGFFATNPALKLFALSIAILLWLFIMYKGQVERVIEAPIDFRNIPKGLEIVKSNAKTVNITVRGPERLLTSSRLIDARASVNLSNAKKGENTFIINEADIIVSRAIKVLRVEPSVIRLQIDEFIRKTLPVKASIIGTPDKHYRVKAIKVTPNFIDIEGPKASLASLSILRAEPIDVTDIDTDIVQSARVVVSDKNIRLSATEVSVTISLERIKK